jgi:hypothetical protein
MIAKAKTCIGGAALFNYVINPLVHDKTIK